VIQKHLSGKKEKKERALALRMRGFSYSEIEKLDLVPKSTLSGWLRDVKLPEKEKKRLVQRQVNVLLAAAREKKVRRVNSTALIRDIAARDIRTISKKELWLIGIILYWARGLQEKEHRPGLGVRFTSSDPHLIKLFMIWLSKVGKIKHGELGFYIFIHERKRNDMGAIINHWSKVTDIAPAYFSHVYFHKNKSQRKRKQNKSTHGLMQVRVKASSLLSRQITGWIQGIQKILPKIAL
jgi:hypothetical protein